jgi:hypothetical protein
MIVDWDRAIRGVKKAGNEKRVVVIGDGQVSCERRLDLQSYHSKLLRMRLV